MHADDVMHIHTTLHAYLNKKIQLMLTRCTKAYSSSCLQIVLVLSPAISSQFIQQ